MTSDTHGPTFSLLAGVLKPKLKNSSVWRQSKTKRIFNAAKSQRSRYPRQVTLATKPFDAKDDGQ